MSTRISAPRFAVWLACLLSVAFAASGQEDELSSRLSAAAAQRGATGTLITESRGKLAAGALEKVQVTLTPRQCIVAGVAVDGAVPDVELSLRTPEGLSLADGTSSSIGLIRYCAGLSEEKALLRIKAEKPTPYALAVWPAGVTGQRVVVRTGTPVDAAVPAPATAKPATLPRRLSELTAAQVKGMQPMMPPREEDMGEGDPRARDVVLEAERCYRVLAVGEAPLVGLELALKDDHGAELAAKKNGELKEGELKPGELKEGELIAALPEHAPVCPPKTGLYTLHLSVKGGAGHVLWQLFGAANPALETRWAVGGSEESLLAKRVRALHDQRDATKAPASPFVTGQLNTAEQVEHGFEVHAGRCYVAIGVGVPSLRALDIAILDQRGNVIAQVHDAGSVVRASACAELNGRWSVRLRAFKGYGGYGFQVFSGL